MQHALVCGGLVVVVGLAGCSGESPEEAGQDYCDAVAGYEDEVAAFGELAAGDATVAELTEQGTAVRDAAATVLDQRRDIDDAIVDAVERARGDFAAAIGQIPGDASLSEARDIYRTAARNYLTSVRAVAEDLGCG
jgi:hypothetical protein